jgi:hypothetical protein
MRGRHTPGLRLMQTFHDVPSPNGHHPSTPRASRIELPAALSVTAELWMGGAHSAFGDAVHVGDLENAWVLDLANDMPDDHRAAAALLLHRVFGDSEEVPSAYARIDSLARSLAACLAGQDGDGRWDHPQEPPRRLYVMCSQGLNRSGLVTGRILRALGLSGEEAVAAVQRHRPGALNNLIFAGLVREGA